MVAVIDPLSGVVSMVDTVLTRLEAREQKLKERMDVLDALIDLLHVLRAWADAAAHTDAALSSWLKTKRSPEAERKLRGAVIAQHHPAQDAQWRFRPQRQSRKDESQSRKDVGPARASLSDVLYVYAPELEAEFAKVLAERNEVLASFERERPGFLRRWAGALAPSDRTAEAAYIDLQEVRQTTSNLQRATRQLAEFIATHFDPKDVSIHS
jgi:hypothetical protein